MNTGTIILRIVYLLFGLAAGYDIAKSIHATSYEFSLLTYLPFFLALAAGEFLSLRIFKGGKNKN